ncbi:MAG: sulfatase [Planctomycetaceae bacterium]|nr:sulfatase [Planctomycetaceae bacterium]
MSLAGVQLLRSRRLRVHRLGLVILLLAVVIVADARRVVAAPARPNILFIFTDDHAAHALSCYGSRVNQTPNLDRIAEGGILFRNCFVTNSVCGPSRAVIQTGLYSHQNGFLRNGDRFNGAQRTFPKLLQTAGYQTAVIGKWHLGEHQPPQGFHYSEVLIGQGPYYNPVFLRDERGDGQQVKTPYTGYTTDIITDRALDWLQHGRDPSKPFLLMCQHKAPHRQWDPDPAHFSMFANADVPEPATLFDDWSGRGRAAHEQDMTIEHTLTERDLKLVPPSELNAEQLAAWNSFYQPQMDAFRAANLQGRDLVRWKYQRYMQDYLRCIASVDDNVGRVLDWLDETGLAQNTVVMYAADNGFYLGDHGWFDKRFMYEESLRIPFLVKWPGVTDGGSGSTAIRENTDFVSNIDFAETFLDLAGVDVPDDMQGRSLVPVIEGRTPADWRTSFYYQYYEHSSKRQWVHNVYKHYGVRTPQHKLIYYYEIDEWELFDLEQDPDELQNVYADPEYAAVVTDLSTELTRLREELKVPEDSEP